ncbi:hypothetical protein KI387_044392, partial [Taxus chinensis]
LITSPLGNVPTRPKQLPKGKGKDKVGEASTAQEKALEIPPTTAEEQVMDLVTARKEEA